VNDTRTATFRNKPKAMAWLFGISLTGLLLAGCNSQSKTVETTAVVRPALVESVSAHKNAHLSFNGVVRASERADLSFRINGRLTDILVEEGDRVVRGQLLATLDSKDAEIALASAELELDNLAAEYKRALTIYEKSNAISKSSLDELTTRYNLAQNRRDEALRQVEYTKVEAPFDGVIGRKWVDNHMQIQANEAIFTLHDLDTMEVVIHISDNVMMSGLKSTKAIAEITAIPSQVFDLSLGTHATQADPISQSYAVVLRLDDLKGFRLLPGMTAKVRPVDDHVVSGSQYITLPVTSVVPDNQGRQFVWLVNDNNLITRRYVQVGALSQDRLEISQGLTVGESVVIAGVSSLHEGMEVRPILSVGNGSQEVQQ
jgi:RND family efflux transporter MFP subunit